MTNPWYMVFDKQKDNNNFMSALSLSEALKVHRIRCLKCGADINLEKTEIDVSTICENLVLITLSYICKRCGHINDEKDYYVDKKENYNGV